MQHYSNCDSICIAINNRNLNSMFRVHNTAYRIGYTGSIKSMGIIKYRSSHCQQYWIGDRYISRFKCNNLYEQ